MAGVVLEAGFVVMDFVTTKSILRWAFAAIWLSLLVCDTSLFTVVLVAAMLAVLVNSPDVVPKTTAVIVMVV